MLWLPRAQALQHGFERRHHQPPLGARSAPPDGRAPPCACPWPRRRARHDRRAGSRQGGSKSTLSCGAKLRAARAIRSARVSARDVQQRTTRAHGRFIRRLCKLGRHDPSSAHGGSASRSSRRRRRCPHICLDSRSDSPSLRDRLDHAAGPPPARRQLECVATNARAAEGSGRPPLLVANATRPTASAEQSFGQTPTTRSRPRDGRDWLRQRQT
jgi:hypothetical protein